MKKLGIVILSGLLLLSFSACKNGYTEQNKTKKEGKIAITLNPERLMTLNWNIPEVDEWKITVSDTESGITYSTSAEIEDSVLTASIPAGEYNLEVNGIKKPRGADNGYQVYGKKDSVNIVENEIANCSVFLGLKKSDMGMGMFSYQLTIRDTDFLNQMGYDSPSGTETSFRLGDYTLSAELTSVKNGYVVPLVVKSVGTNAGRTQATVLFSKDEIPSGYYYLSVYHAKEDLPRIILNLDHDSLVEISDGAETKGSGYLNTLYEKYDNRNLYVCNNEAKNNNGVLPANPTGINNALKLLNETYNEWVTVNLYFMSDMDDSMLFIEKMKGAIPFINVDIPLPSKADDGKTVNIYVGGKLYYIISDGKIVIPSTLSFDGSKKFEMAFVSDNTENLADFTVYIEERGERTFGETNIYIENVCLHLADCSDNFESLNVYEKGIGLLKETPSLIFEELSFKNVDETDPENPIPKNPLSIFYSNVLDDDTLTSNCIFNSVLGEYDIDERICEYSYISSTAGSATMNISETIKRFEIKGDVTYDGKAIETEDTGLEFYISADDYTADAVYTWYINDTEITPSVLANHSEILVEEDFNRSTILIYPLLCNLIKGNDNIVKCVAFKDGAYASSSIKFDIEW